MDGLPCGGELESPIEVGDEFYVFFEPGNSNATFCRPYVACTDEQCEPLLTDGFDTPPDDPSWGAWEVCDAECEVTTADTCALEPQRREEERWTTGTVLLARWNEEELALGVYGEVETTLLTADIPLLADEQACLDAYPDERQPCGDSSGCVVAERPRVPELPLLVAAMVCVVATRRPRPGGPV